MALFQKLKTPFVEDQHPSDAAPPEGVQSAGEVLRQRREALGLDLCQIAGTLRIKTAYLSALEEGRLDRLPGPAYAAGFLRAYGEHLGLGGAETLRRFKVETTGLDAKPDLSFPMPLGERSVPGGAMLLVAFILVICGYGTWYYLSTGNQSHPERVSEVPIALLPPKPAPPVPAPASSTSKASPAPTDGSAPPTADVEAAKMAPRADPTSPKPAAEPPATRASTAPTEVAPVLIMPALAALPASPGAAPGERTSISQQDEGSPSYGDGPARIVMRAVADSWVQVRAADRSPLFTRLLKTGESYRVPEQPGVSMRTGNAGGLEITVDGKPAPSLGPMGAVRRDVALDPEKLLAGTAVRE